MVDGFDDGDLIVENWLREVQRSPGVVASGPEAKGTCSWPSSATPGASFQANFDGSAPTSTPGVAAVQEAALRS